IARLFSGRRWSGRSWFVRQSAVSTPPQVPRFVQKTCTWLDDFRLLKIVRRMPLQLWSRPGWGQPAGCGVWTSGRIACSFMLISRIVFRLPLRVIRRIVNDVLAERTRQDLRRQRPSLDSARAPAASAAAAGVLQRGGPLQAARLVLRQEGALRALS